jgi:hypothetical protein
MVVEEMPEFPGGMEGLTEYLSENLKYPAEAREKNVQGTVFLSFVVQADGTVTDITTLKASARAATKRPAGCLPRCLPGSPAARAASRAGAVLPAHPVRDGLTPLLFECADAISPVAGPRQRNGTPFISPKPLYP